MQSEDDDDSPYFVIIALDEQFMKIINPEMNEDEDDPGIIDHELLIKNEIFLDIIKTEITMMFGLCKDAESEGRKDKMAIQEHSSKKSDGSSSSLSMLPVQKVRSTSFKFEQLMKSQIKNFAQILNYY